MPYNRELLDILMQFIERREIIGIRGARQVGKTTLLKMLKEKLENRSSKSNKSKINIAFLNLDFMELRQQLQDNPRAIIERYGDKQNTWFLFLDEIQNVKNAGNILKLWYDEIPNLKIFFTGSSSLEIRQKILPSLVGRLFLFNIYSFSFSEFIEAHDSGLYRILSEQKKKLKELIKQLSSQPMNPRLENLPFPSFAAELSALLNEYMIWGGYPEVIKTVEQLMKKTILQNIITLYLEKDVSEYFKIKDSTKFFKLCRLLASQIGGFIVNSEFSSELQMSRNTVDSYLEILQHSYIIKTIRPFHKNMRNELRKQEKVYFLDFGIRNALISNFTPFENRMGHEKGCLLENFVFRELLTSFTENLEGFEIRYWRTTNKTEVDFVLISKDESLLIPIEVKLGGKKVSRGFYSFIREYGVKLAIVATFDTFKVEKCKDFTVLWIPAYYL